MPTAYPCAQSSPFCVQRSLARVVRTKAQPPEGGGGPNFPDPEAKFSRYGKFFGGNYSLAREFLNSAPRVRFRKNVDRGVEQLSELAILNERLAGGNAWEIRRKVEYLKTRRKNWEMIYKHIISVDAEATLKSLEEANQKVNQALSEDSRDTKSVGDLKQLLVDLQGEVNEAHERLHLTESRMKQNMDRISSLKNEAEALDKMKGAAASEPLLAGKTSVESLPDKVTVTSFEESTPKQSKKKKSKGLQSSLEMESGLENFWYPVAFSSKLKGDTLIPIQLLDKPWVLFRDGDGIASCVRDECAHRACPLSLGSVVDGKLVCPYHGWEYNREGACTHMPSTAQCKGIKVASISVAEKDGFVWVWPGDEVPTEVPECTLPPSGYAIHAEIEVTVPVDHGLLLENLLDLAHAPFTHTSTFAKGWPIPDIVKFRTAQLLGGNWEPYPIDMSFEPPCMVVSKIGLAQPGKIMRGQRADTCEKHLHQLHACLPSRQGEVRLLYRMSLDFLQWMRFIPMMDKFWMQIANQVLGEDLVLVQGQQKRMQKGGDTWANPVSYDKLAVRYRRWRNSVDSPNSKDSHKSGRTHMSAGEMLRPED